MKSADGGYAVIETLTELPCFPPIGLAVLHWDVDCEVKTVMWLVNERCISVQVVGYEFQTWQELVEEAEKWLTEEGTRKSDWCPPKEQGVERLGRSNERLT